MSWLNSFNKLRLTRLSSLANSALREGDLGRAEAFNKKALQLVRETCGNSLPTVNFHSNLGSIYAAQNRSAEAESHYRTALEITEQALGKDHLGVTKPLYELADFLYNNALKDRIETEELSEPIQELSDLLYYNTMDETDSHTKARCLTDAEALYARAQAIESAAGTSRLN